MTKNKSIDEQLNELTSIYENGGGYGAPEAERELERKIDLLKHRQTNAINKKNSRIAVINVILVVINVAILIYQVFFSK